MRILRNVSKILVFVLTSGLLLACNVINQNSRFPGVTYITSLGNPPADTVVWSPKDSTKILVSANGLASHSARVYILDIVTKEKTMLVDTDYGDMWGSAWLPDGKHIAFTVAGATKGFTQGGLWVINTENNSTENFTDREGNAVWLPDGNTLAFLTVDSASNQKPRQFSISLIDIQTKESELVFSGDAAMAYLGFSSSPDGQYLVLSLMFDIYSTASDLYILDVQTGTLNQLTHDGVSSFPQWSPYGDMIAYQKTVSIGNKTTESLHIILPDGSCDIEVPNVDYALSPTWSPDGRKIAFIGDDGIYVLDTEIVFGRDIYQNLCP